MKLKISPQDYNEILSSLELKTLFLKDIKAENKEEYLSQSLEIDIKEKVEFKQEGRNVNFTFKFSLKAKDQEKEGAAISITATYTVLYAQNKDIAITAEFVEVFNKMTLGMLLWPYFRELTSNTIYRMNLPPLVLALRKN
jgi:preprotein translocase subunit SecB